MFTAEQRWWLDHIAAHIGVNLSVAPDDFEYIVQDLQAALAQFAAIAEDLGVEQDLDESMVE